MLGAIFWLLAALATLGALVALAAAARVRRFFAVPATGIATERAPVSVLVPLRGAPSGLEHRLGALLRATRAGDQILFSVESIHDPAYAVCAGVAAEAAQHATRDVRIVLSGAPGQRMGKQHNLAAALLEAKHDLIASMDGDVVLEPGHLDEAAALADRDDAGIAFALPYYGGRGSAGDALVALYTNHYFCLYLGSLALTHRPAFVIGGFWLARRAALERVGGLEPFTGTVSDDAALGRSMRDAGLRNAPLHRPVRLAPAGLRAGAGGTQVLRWLTMLRAEGWRTFALIAASWHPVAWAALALAWSAVTGGGPLGMAWLVLTVAVGSRVVAVVTLNEDVYGAEPRGRYALVAPLYEALVAPVLFVVAAARRELLWSGRRYRIGAHGSIRGVRGR